MLHGRIGPMRPEQFPKQFRAYSHDTTTTERGREKQGERKLIGEFRGILASAKPDEQDRYRQLNKVVTHAIIQRGAPIANEYDTLVLIKNGKESRSFRIQAAHNKGELDIDTVYMCEERSDVT